MTTTTRETTSLFLLFCMLLLSKQKERHFNSCIEIVFCVLLNPKREKGDGGGNEMEWYSGGKERRKKKNEWCTNNKRKKKREEEEDDEVAWQRGDAESKQPTITLLFSTTINYSFNNEYPSTLFLLQSQQARSATFKYALTCFSNYTFAYLWRSIFILSFFLFLLVNHSKA